MDYKFREEQMNGEFTKYHLEGFPFHAVLHKFSSKGLDAQPHCHPWGFTSFIVKSGYTERVYTVKDDGSWSSELVTHRPGDSFFVPATQIHALVEFLEEECWTFILPGPWERDSLVWDFTTDKATSKGWWE